LIPCFLAVEIRASRRHTEPVVLPPELVLVRHAELAVPSSCRRSLARGRARAPPPLLLLLRVGRPGRGTPPEELAEEREREGARHRARARRDPLLLGELEAAEARADAPHAQAEEEEAGAREKGLGRGSPAVIRFCSENSRPPGLEPTRHTRKPKKRKPELERRASAAAPCSARPPLQVAAATVAAGDPSRRRRGLAVAPVTVRRGSREKGRAGGAEAGLVGERGWKGKGEGALGVLESAAKSGPGIYTHVPASQQA
jgi:hypothetical protein